MKKLIIKAGIGAAGALFLAGALIPAFAGGQDVTCKIKGNGAFSKNKCKVLVASVNLSWQKNIAKVGNLVVVVANTGLNSASGNTGGDVTVEAGDADVTTTITNNINQNTP
ncbi:MAG: hypothetical protein A2Y57_00645 [Candidatus Woykebacteria bacterium RBG_13_40_7b]|uniref:Uncharacterized protein n=1 Tax=Candidatus Woykebacteria bacterium RBG_13_40_7b TaxID=1802594 RepID=A0A1G1W9E5_9BACT|nr:MAG: hypothetical protein A2Y57_00645 [Candidatus Woykebacteria bacterium RBG_13_40_7b]